MKAADVVLFSIAALSAARIRTFLMLLAMAIGVAAVVLLTGVGNGARLYVTDEFTSLGTNLIIIVPGRTETAAGMPSTFVGETPRDLTLTDASSLARLHQVRRVAPISVGEVSVSYQGLERRVPLIGSTSQYQPVRRLQLAQGNFLPRGDHHSSRPVCVLGAKVSQELFGTGPAVGTLVRIGGFRCRVIGVLASRGRSLGMDTEEMVIVPVAFAQMVLNTEGLFRILVQAREGVDLDLLKTRILEVVSRNHHGEKDITVITQDAVLATFDRILSVLTMTVAGIAAVSLIVAGILIMNVMLVAVSQRTAEIGLFKALGARNSQVMALILTEAALLSISGGVMGLGVGRIGVILVERLYPQLQAAPPLWAIWAALATSLITGLLFGLLPARRAARLDPIQALAHH